MGSGERERQREREERRLGGKGRKCCVRSAVYFGWLRGIPSGDSHHQSEAPEIRQTQCPRVSSN